MKRQLLFCLIMLLLSIQVTAQQGGYALQFEGSTQKVTVPNHSSIQFSGSANFTIEAWVYPTGGVGTAGWSVIVSKLVHLSDKEGYSLEMGSDYKITFIAGNNWNNYYLITSSTGIPTNQWSHICSVFDGPSNAMRLYINGSLAASGTWSSGLTDSGTDLQISGRPTYANTNFIGSVDEVRIWNIARTEAEIKANMYKQIGAHTNLKAYYQMSEGTGTSLTDNSGNSNTGTLTNGPTWKVSGCFAGSRQALDFDGTDDYVGVPYSALFNVSKVTLEAWIYWKETNPSEIDFLIAKGIEELEIQVNCNNHSIRFIPTDDVYLDSPDDVFESNQWNHFAFMYDPGIGFAKGYVNGVEVTLTNAGSNPLTTAITSQSVNFNIGRRSNNQHYFNGIIDEVRIWSDVRTESEIRENMMKNLIGNETGLVACYRFDQYDGTTLYDITTNGNNGSLTNMDAATDWVSSTAFNTWLGGESNAWSTSANWSNGVPAAAQSAGIYNWSGALPNVTSYLPVIPASVTINNLLIPSDVSTSGNVNLSATGSVFLGSSMTLDASALNTADNLVVESGKTLTLPTGGQLTVARQLDNKGSFTMQSGSSLITNGTLTNSGAMQISRTLTESVWHMFSIPVAGITANSFLGDYLQSWNETTGEWVNISNPFTALNTKQGYSLWATPTKTNATYTFTGTLLTGNQSTPITYTAVSGKDFDGANLLGNPYPSSIDWDQLQATYGSNYIWDGTAYKAYSSQSGYDLGYRYIPPMQGFFILTTNPTDNFNLTAATRTHEGAANFYKSSGSKSFNKGIVLEATNGSYSDEWCLVFTPEAYENFELPRDAWKLPSNTTGISQLWSVCPDGNLAIDIRPETETIQLGFSNNQPGIYTIGINEIADITSAVLEDTKTGILYNLQNGAYEFAWNPEVDAETRFKLHLNSVGIEEIPNSDSKILIYAANGQIFIKNPTGVETDGRPYLLTVSDVMGRVALRQEISGEETIAIPANLQTGVYLVTVQNGKEVKTEKVFIK